MEFKDLEVGKTYIALGGQVEAVISGFTPEDIVTTIEKPGNLLSYSKGDEKRNPMNKEGHFGFTTKAFLRNFKRKEEK